MEQVVGGQDGFALAASGDRVRVRAGRGVAVVVAWAVGRAVGDEQNVVVATGKVIRWDSSAGIAVLYGAHVVVGAGVDGVRNIVLQCASGGCVPVENQAAIRGWCHGLRDLGRCCLRDGCIVRCAEEGGELSVPAAATGGAAR